MRKLVLAMGGLLALAHAARAQNFNYQYNYPPYFYGGGAVPYSVYSSPYTGTYVWSPNYNYTPLPGGGYYLNYTPYTPYYYGNGFGNSGGYLIRDHHLPHHHSGARR